LSFISNPRKVMPMQTSNFRRFVLLAFGTLLLSIVSGSADETVNTGIPGGDGKDLMANPNGEMADQQTIVIHDEECAKKSKGKGKLRDGKADPAYEACVHAKLEKAKKKSEH
jgi:hypothetical protein